MPRIHPIVFTSSLCLASAQIMTYADPAKSGPVITIEEIAQAPSRSLHPCATEWAILHYLKQRIILGAELDLFTLRTDADQGASFVDQLKNELEIRNSLDLNHIPLSLKRAVIEETQALTDFLECVTTHPSDTIELEKEEKKVRHCANQTNIVLEQLGFSIPRFMKISAEYVNELLIITSASMADALQYFGFSEENPPSDPSKHIAVRRLATQMAINLEKEKLRTFFSLHKQ